MQLFVRINHQEEHCLVLVLCLVAQALPDSLYAACNDPEAFLASQRVELLSGELAAYEG